MLILESDKQALYLEKQKADMLARHSSYARHVRILGPHATNDAVSYMSDFSYSEFFVNGSNHGHIIMSPIQYFNLEQGRLPTQLLVL